MAKEKDETVDDKQKRADDEGKKLRQANAEDVPLGSGTAEEAKKKILSRKERMKKAMEDAGF